MNPPLAIGVRKGLIASAIDARCGDLYRVAINLTVDLLEERITQEELPHLIVPKYGLLEQSNFSHYPFHGSLPPEGYIPNFHYTP